MLFSLFLVLMCFWSYGEAGKCRLYDYCQSYGVCRGFTSLAEVNEAAEKCLKEEEHSLFYYFYQTEEPFTFVSVTEQELNTRFDFHLWKWIMYNNVKRNDYTLIIWNVASIDYTNYSSKYSKKSMGKFEFASVEIEIAKSGRFDKSPCDQSTSSWSNFLSSITHELEIRGGRYLNYLCPYWFKDVELNSLTVQSNNGFKFKEVVGLEKVDFSSNILALDLKTMHKLVLDQNLLSPTLFANLKSLALTECSLSRISPTSLFKDFSKLKSIDLTLINQRGFFHSTNGTAWMAYLNYHVYFDLDKFISTWMNETEYEYFSQNPLTVYMILSEYENSLSPYFWYAFPDEDFCLFHDFPHQQLVVPKIVSFAEHSECTCTLVWLLKYNGLVYQKYNMSFLQLDIVDVLANGKLVCSPDKINIFKPVFESCNVTMRLGLCSIQGVPPSHDQYFDLYDLKNGIQAAHLYLLTYAGPAISAIGVVANLIIVVVFLQNRHVSRRFKATGNSSREIKLFDERLYQLMFINAVINLIYCLMYLLDFTITCTPVPYYALDDLLPKSNLTGINCLVKDCVIGFIASSLKIVSNTLLVFISLSRYILIGKEHKKFVIKLTSISNKKLLIWSTIGASLLSVIVVFQYITWSNQRIFKNGSPSYTELYTYDYYPFYFNGFLTHDAVLKHLQQISVVTAFSVIHDCFSYLFFCFIILILDIATVKKLRETLAQKSNISKVSDNKEKMEQKSITMVWINSIVNFVLRLPEILSMVCFIFFDVNPYIYKVLCLMFNRCLTLYDLSNVAYILSLSTPLFFYLGFNTNFDTAFKAMWNNVRTAIQQIKEKKYMF